MFKWMFLGLLTPLTAETGAQILKKPIPDKLVVLTFDDAVKSHYSVVAPILKHYGFGATFFVCEFPPDFVDTTKYMTWNQISELNKMGFEIGNHTQNHVDVDKVGKDKLNGELEYIEQKCSSLDIAKPVSFAYPGYVTHPHALETLEERGYRFARTGGDRVYDPAKEHPSLVPGYTALATNKKEIMKAFGEARNGKITVVTFHGIPDNAHPWVTTPPALFKEYMQFLHDDGYTVIAMKDLLAYVNVEKAVKEIEPVFPVQPLSKKRLAVLVAGIAVLAVGAWLAWRYKRKMPVAKG